MMKITSSYVYQYNTIFTQSYRSVTFLQSQIFKFPNSHISTFTHSHIHKFSQSQILFGEHLLNEDPSAPVAIVESEKTAIIAMAKIPDYLWLATGSLNEFKPSKLNILKGRRVVAFPDLGAYDRWCKKASSFDFTIEVSDYLERNATPEQLKEGMDIGDFL